MSTKKREILHWSWCNIDFKQYLSPFTSDFIYAITLNRKTMTLGSVEKNEICSKRVESRFFYFLSRNIFSLYSEKIKNIFQCARMLHIDVVNFSCNL